MSSPILSEYWGTCPPHAPAIAAPEWTDFNETWHKYSLCDFKMRGQRSMPWPDQSTYNGGDIHYDCVAPRVTCLIAQETHDVKRRTDIATKNPLPDSNLPNLLLQFLILRQNLLTKLGLTTCETKSFRWDVMEFFFFNLEM